MCLSTRDHDADNFWSRKPGPTIENRPWTDKVRFFQSADRPIAIAGTGRYLAPLPKGRQAGMHACSGAEFAARGSSSTARGGPRRHRLRKSLPEGARASSRFA